MMLAIRLSVGRSRQLGLEAERSSGLTPKGEVPTAVRQETTFGKKDKGGSEGPSAEPSSVLKRSSSIVLNTAHYKEVWKTLIPGYVRK